MFIEKLVLENFQCFGPERTSITLDPRMTAFVGANGSGKTATCEALLRLFGISRQERTVRAEDFHVPADETAAPPVRTLTVEAVLAFPELEADTGAHTGGADNTGEGPAATAPDNGHQDETPRSVPEFFRRMAATESGDLKVRIVLHAEWADDGTAEGAIEEKRLVISTLDEEYGEEEQVPLTAKERSRIQMIYIPASRDGVRQVTSFLRGRLWRAAQWSPALRTLVTDSADKVAGTFGDEPVVQAVEGALARRWQELYDAGIHSDPKLRLLDNDFNELVRDSQLVFEPDPQGRPRSAHMLSDGQRSLLHLALVAATLDVEAAVCAGEHKDAFGLDAAHLPNLTLIAVEEPENSLSPYFLSRIVGQLQDLTQSTATQAILSSHSASVMTRIEPEDVRYFRVETATATTRVRHISLPPDSSDAGKYVREAVRAHPELYFSRFAVLGEGDSEELAIPRIARALGTQLDPSFVAMVPLGGRHTNHMWKLLSDLDIPHATLLDLDYGKGGSGPARLRDACRRLIENGLDPLKELEGYAKIGDISDDLRLEDITPIILHLRRFGIFFAEPLDLDYAMLRAFENAYTHLEGNQRGPKAENPVLTVLGKDGTRPEYWAAEGRPEWLGWYLYLFLTNSKPSTHMSALSRISDDDLKRDTPDFLKALVEHVRQQVFL
ncbi:ATP-dependent endonuclease [Streptomyces sp. NPDC048590]|uniref:ATP-dependent nuclease n=1 Tax=Streptomyces sp. NPDC048590 TaxID=3365574 RepID=UPI00371AC006